MECKNYRHLITTFGRILGGFAFVMLFTPTSGFSQSKISPSRVSLAQAPSAGKQELNPAWIRRMVVFPFKFDDQDPTWNATVSAKMDAAWWRVREILTEPRRFLIASKQFLTQKDVYQPRALLQPADVILLGKLLDASTIMTSELKGHDLSLQVYSCKDGQRLWQDRVQLNDSVPLEQQIIPQYERLTHTFLATIPYQGFQVIDPLIGTPTYEDGDVKLAKVDVGNQGLIKPGDPVEWVQIERANMEPLFGAGGKISVLAEGEVASREGDILIIKILRTKNPEILKEKAFVSFPNERERLNGSAMIGASGTDIKVVPEWVKAEIQPAAEKKAEAKPLVMTFTAIANMVALVLLAL